MPPKNQLDQHISQYDRHKQAKKNGTAALSSIFPQKYSRYENTAATTSTALKNGAKREVCEPQL